MMKRLVLVACLPLSGCFFVFIPPGLINKMAGAPTHCAAVRLKQGDTFLTTNGQRWQVTRPNETAGFCPAGQYGVDAEEVKS